MKDGDEIEVTVEMDGGRNYEKIMVFFLSIFSTFLVFILKLIRIIQANIQAKKE
jgi:hypothetical protein